MNPTRAVELFDFMNARHSIYLHRRDGYLPPWTNDTILRTYRFCNVYRELDSVTQWIDKNIRKPYADHPNLWFMLCIARQINWPPTLQELMDEGCWPTKRWAWEKARGVMLDRKVRGEQVYTGAYILNARGVGAGDPRDKSYFTCKHVLGSVWGDRKDLSKAITSNLEQAWKSLLPYIGWGPFMAYEVVSDLRHTRYLNKADDIMTWANAGPGAIRGLNRVFGRPVRMRPRLKSSVAVDEMRMLLTEADKYWPYKWPRLEMREIEHSLCEFDKYERVRLGEGQPRSRYNDGSAI